MLELWVLDELDEEEDDASLLREGPELEPEARVDAEELVPVDEGGELDEPEELPGGLLVARKTPSEERTSITITTAARTPLEVNSHSIDQRICCKLILGLFNLALCRRESARARGFRAMALAKKKGEGAEYV